MSMVQPRRDAGDRRSQLLPARGRRCRGSRCAAGTPGARSRTTSMTGSRLRTGCSSSVTSRSVRPALRCMPAWRSSGTSSDSTGTAARVVPRGRRCIAAGVRPWTSRRRRDCRSRSRWSFRSGRNGRDCTCGAPSG